MPRRFDDLVSIPQCGVPAPPCPGTPTTAARARTRNRRSMRPAMRRRRVRGLGPIPLSIGSRHVAPPHTCGGLSRSFGVAGFEIGGCS